MLECPDLFPMAVDGDPDDVRWVLVAGANGAAEGMTTGTAYWVGEWDGERFTPDDTGHQWLDHGPDYYAAVTWDDPRRDEHGRLAARYGIGWMNNWAYAGGFPTEDWHGGSDSLVRTITLSDDEGRATLHSEPAPELGSLSGDPEHLDDVRLTDGEAVDVTVPASGAYRLRLDAASPAGELRVKVLTGDGSFATVGYDFAARSVFVARDADAVADTMPEAYREVRTAAVEPEDGRIALDIVVDASSIEVFAGGGRAALTMATFGTSGARGHCHRLTFDEPAAEQVDAVADRRCGPVDPVEQAGHAPPPHLVVRQRDRGEPGVEGVGDRMQIVDPHDAEAVRDGDAAPRRGLHHAHGDLVVEADDGCGRDELIEESSSRFSTACRIGGAEVEATVG